MADKGHGSDDLGGREYLNDEPDLSCPPSTSSNGCDNNQASSSYSDRATETVNTSEYEADDEQELKNNDDGSEQNVNSEEFIDEAANCDESMPSSRDMTDLDLSSSNPPSNDVSELSFPELLKTHLNQLVSGFEFGEQVKRQAQENMRSARDRMGCEESRLAEKTNANKNKETDLEQPCCSQTASENDHKTPHAHKRQRLGDGDDNKPNLDVDFANNSRNVPKPLQDHAGCVEVWRYMVYKEEATLKLRNARLFSDFKTVTPRMRAILLDWLMEVAEVYHLRRITYYLGVDYFDRFLSIRPDIPKSMLQLVGITCLYIAAKVEEIYPPNLSEFAYVCDGACKAEEMVSCEILILNSLGWEVVLMTPSDWLNLYMQLVYKADELIQAGLTMDFNNDFMYPQYSAYQFTRASQLMDLLSLDPGFLKFSYSTIAASALFYMYGKKVALEISGLTWEQLKPCVKYMAAFYRTLKDAPDPRLYCVPVSAQPEETSRLMTIKSGPQSESYSLQTHIANMEYFEQATIDRLQRLTNKNAKKKENQTKDGVNSNTDTCKQEAAAEESENNANIINNDDAQTKPSSEDGEDEKSGTNKSEVKNTVLDVDEMFELIFAQEALQN